MGGGTFDIRGIIATPEHALPEHVRIRCFVGHGGVGQIAPALTGLGGRFGRAALGEQAAGEGEFGRAPIAMTIMSVTMRTEGPLVSGPGRGWQVLWRRRHAKPHHARKATPLISMPKPGARCCCAVSNCNEY